MRVIIRIFSLTIIGLLISIVLIHCLDLNIRIDELNKTSSLAMSNTQILIQEIIEDRLYGTSNARRNISSNEEYLDLYKDNFYKLINTNSEYEIIDYYADYLRGLLYVNINCKYHTVMGKEKTLNKRLLNIIDVVNE